MELKKCPYCGKSILVFAKTCKYCGKSLQQQEDNIPNKELIANPQQLTAQQQQVVIPSPVFNYPQPKQAKASSYKNILFIAAVVVVSITSIVAIVNSSSKRTTTNEYIDTKKVAPEEVIQTPKNNEGEVSNDIPKEQQIKDFIISFYQSQQNKEFDRITDFYADIVPRFYDKTNISKIEIRDGLIKYHEQTLKTISITPSFRWETFEMTNDGDITKVSFIMDYYLNTEKFGNQKYVISVKIDIDRQFKIVGISEETLEKENL